MGAFAALAALPLAPSAAPTEAQIRADPAFISLVAKGIRTYTVAGIQARIPELAPAIDFALCYAHANWESVAASDAAAQRDDILVVRGLRRSLEKESGLPMEERSARMRIPKRFSRSGRSSCKAFP